MVRFIKDTNSKGRTKRCVTEQPKKKEPIEISEDKVLDTKFTLSVQTMIASSTGLASLIGMWYCKSLSIAEIEEAKENTRY